MNRVPKTKTSVDLPTAREQQSRSSASAISMRHGSSLRAQCWQTHCLMSARSTNARSIASDTFEVVSTKTFSRSRRLSI